MRRNTCALACALVLVLAGTAMAQSSDPAYGNQTNSTPEATGTVVSFANNALVISLDDGTQRTYTGEPSSSAPADLHPGQTVRVEGRKMPDGSYTYSSISLTPSASAEAPKAADSGAGPGAGSGSGSSLPRTASPLPLVGLAGALALGAGLTLRGVLRH